MSEKSKYLPEGTNKNNFQYLGSISELLRAKEMGLILEANAVLCDYQHNLTVDLGNGVIGKIPFEECAIGIKENTTRSIAIISRVGKPVCFKVTEVLEDNTVILSRREAQLESLNYYMTKACPGDIIPCKVTHLEQFGAFVDIGCGVISLIGIENISISRIFHPSQRFSIGSEIFAVISEIDHTLNRIILSHKELLGTWDENAQNFKAGETVMGVVRSIEEYGIFIELAPNLSGLAEPKPDIKVSDHISVFIKSIIKERMKIKLVIINKTQDDIASVPYKYYITSGHIDSFQYSPEECEFKKIITVFKSKDA